MKINNKKFIIISLIFTTFTVTLITTLVQVQVVGALGLFTLDPECTVHNLRTFELWVPRPSVVDLYYSICVIC